ncbi:hypothetical protein D1AOALGA4SA_2733 [Olavius algarvensis Delta 1 endosymbiont]|nr:hypothetical protein D1AOALGA4SA_2733 [Olavius algarvensis Delta 1 endosymbiont]
MTVVVGFLINNYRLLDSSFNLSESPLINTSFLALDHFFTCRSRFTALSRPLNLS